MKKHPRILYFTASAVPTQEEAAAAARLGTNVAFRNAQLVDKDSSLEACDGIAGNAPSKYVDKYPHGEKVMTDFVREMQQPPAPPAPPPAPPAPPAPPSPPVPPGTGWSS